MINEELKKGLIAVGIEVADNVSNEDAIKLLKANKKVLKAHDDLEVAKAEGAAVEPKDPEIKETTTPAGAGEGEKKDPGVEETIPPKKVEEKVDEKKVEEVPPKVPAAIPTTPTPSVEPSKPRKFGKNFPDRT